jgi:hypothetical protein
MKSVLTATVIFCLSAAYGQNDPPLPIEEQHPTNYWWWLLGVVLAIGAGIGLYMLIKKDPKRDAVD